jgi:predicted MFS family arabinose efflux permease
MTRIFATLAALYLLQGAALSFFYVAVPAMLRAEGAALALIGATFFAYLPFGLKFLWAPLMDRLWSPRLGRRRSWMLPAQAATVALFAAMAAIDPLADFALMMTLACLVSAAAATQNAATDAWAAESLPPDRRGWANGLQAGAFAVGGLIAGGVGALHGIGGWPAMALAMAAQALLGLLLLLALPVDRGAPAAPAAAVEAPWRRLRSAPLRRALLLVVLARSGINMPFALVGAMAIDAGLSVGAAALLGGAGGSAATLIAAGLGGWMVQRLGPTRALAAAAAACALGSAAIAASLALTGLTVALAIGALLYAFAAGTLVFVALHGQFMAVADPRRAATDLALLTSVEMLLGLGVMAAGGWLAGPLGYGGVFAAAVLPLLATLPLALRRDRAPPLQPAKVTVP